MGKSDELAHYIESVGGVASAARLKSAGFLSGSIAYALDNGSIDKLTRGVYCSPEVFDDEFAAISNRWRKCVFSHGSALFLSGLSDRVPSVLDVTVPHGYNPRALTKKFPDVRIHRVRPDIYEMGLSESKSPGGAYVRSYDAERAVADLIAQRSSKGADPQLVRDAVAGYFRRKDANLPKLARRCAALGVEEEFKIYLEVLR